LRGADEPGDVAEAELRSGGKRRQRLALSAGPDGDRAAETLGGNVEGVAAGKARAAHLHEEVSCAGATEIGAASDVDRDCAAGSFHAEPEHERLGAHLTLCELRLPEQSLGPPGFGSGTAREQTGCHENDEWDGEPFHVSLVGVRAAQRPPSSG